MNLQIAVAGKAKDEYEQVTNKIGDYLRSTNLEELNPEGIKQDLNQLFDEPEQGIKNLRDRLSHVNRETLVKLLSQREDISEEKAEQIVDNVQEAIASIVKAPRRLANRTTKQVQSWESQLEDYLRNTDKEELNPEGIKRELQLLVREPGSGLKQMSDRLSQFDRDTLVALLSSNPAVSEADVNRLIDNIEQARDSVLNRAERLQQEAQKRVDQIKHNAKEQIEQTRKAAATAAWWLFGTALTSAGMAAFAGIIAVRGLTIFS